MSAIFNLGRDAFDIFSMDSQVENFSSLETDFITEQRNGFSVIRVDSVEAERTLETLMPDPDRLFTDAIIVKPGSRTHAGIIEINSCPYFLKRYNCRGWGYRARNVFRRSRAVRAWHAAWMFLAKDVPVARPLVCLGERRFRLLGRSYVLMDYASGSKRLREIWPETGEAERMTLLRNLAALLGRMHRRGCIHGDLKWDNILIGDITAGEAILVDMDGSRSFARPQTKKAHKDLERFMLELSQTNGAEKYVDFFRKSWNRWVTGS